MKEKNINIVAIFYSYVVWWIATFGNIKSFFFFSLPKNGTTFFWSNTRVFAHSFQPLCVAKAFNLNHFCAEFEQLSQNEKLKWVMMTLNRKFQWACRIKQCVFMSNKIVEPKIHRIFVSNLFPQYERKLFDQIFQWHNKFSVGIIDRNWGKMSSRFKLCTFLAIWGLSSKFQIFLLYLSIVFIFRIPHSEIVWTCSRDCYDDLSWFQTF